MFILLRVAKELANAGPGTDSAEEMAREELAAFSLPRFGLLSADCEPVPVHLSPPQCSCALHPFPDKTQPNLI